MSVELLFCVLCIFIVVALRHSLWRINSLKQENATLYLDNTCKSNEISLLSQKVAEQGEEISELKKPVDKGEKFTPDQFKKLIVQQIVRQIIGYSKRNPDAINQIESITEKIFGSEIAFLKFQRYHPEEARISPEQFDSYVDFTVFLYENHPKYAKGYFAIIALQWGDDLEVPSLLWLS